MELGIRVAASVGPGGNYNFSIEVDRAVIRGLCTTAVTLGALYGSYKLVDTVVRKVFGDGRDDQDMDPPEQGSLRVSMRCFTDERFLEVYEDYKSGELKQRLYKEFSNNGIKTEGLEVNIENIKEVEEKAAAINERKSCPMIIVQSGAKSQCDLKGEYMSVVKEATRKGYGILTRGGRAVDAVEAAVRVLEDNEYFNAGKGSPLSNDREVECDAMIMNGNTLDSGAVTSGRNFLNPVSLAKLIMEDSYHCALSGEGALKFAEEKGFPTCNQEELITQRSKNVRVSYKDFITFVNSRFGGRPVGETGEEYRCDTASAVTGDDSSDTASAVVMEDSGDTVSAVARDAEGRFACAVSTGGVAGSLKGRVSDASMVGCGGYANKHGAATTSGLGESIIKMTLARDVVYMMENGQSAQYSAEKSLEKMKKELNDVGGVIAIDKHGSFGKAFGTKIMAWASIKENTLKSGLKQEDDENEEQL